MRNHSDSVTQVAFSPTEESTLLSCSSDKNVKLWDARILQCIKTERTKSGCKNLAWNYNSNFFAFGNKEDDIIYFYDCRKFQPFKHIEFKNKINEFVIDKFGKNLLVASASGSINVINANTLDETQMVSIDAHYAPVNTIGFSRDSTLFATGASDALICLWDYKEMMSYGVMKKGDMPLRKISFSHDSKLLSSIYEGNNLDIFNVDTMECVHSVFTDNPQYSIAWNPRRRVLAYCGDDKNRNNIDEGNIHLLYNE